MDSEDQWAATQSYHQAESRCEPEAIPALNFDVTPVTQGEESELALVQSSAVSYLCIWS